MKVIHIERNYRIIALQDHYFDMESMKGDVFNPVHNEGIPKDQLAKEEQEYEANLETFGVFGLRLEKWNPEVGAGWEEIESCWGFEGFEYKSGKPHETDWNEHYFVSELKDRIPAMIHVIGKSCR